MTREFIILPEFDKRWKKLGLTDDDLVALEEFLCLNPLFGKIIKGTGGLRKLRWALPGKGKSGGIRIIYVDFIIYEKLYLISAYKKNEKVSLTRDEKNKIKEMIKVLLTELRRKRNEEK